MGTIYALIRRAVYIKQQAGVGFPLFKDNGTGSVVVCVFPHAWMYVRVECIDFNNFITADPGLRDQI